MNHDVANRGRQMHPCLDAEQALRSITVDVVYHFNCLYNFDVFIFCFSLFCLSQDAKIFQPIPLHVSPSGNKSLIIDTEQRARTHSGNY